MHTEHEAAAKWCPYRGEVTANADGSRKLVYCIASDCMMWRKGKHSKYCSFSSSIGTSAVITWNCDKLCEHHLGYCGLGGNQ